MPSAYAWFLPVALLQSVRVACLVLLFCRHELVTRSAMIVFSSRSAHPPACLSLVLDSFLLVDHHGTLWSSSLCLFSHASKSAQKTQPKCSPKRSARELCPGVGGKAEASGRSAFDVVLRSRFVSRPVRDCGAAVHLLRLRRRTMISACRSIGPFDLMRRS